jgi:hypothetical protein
LGFSGGLTERKKSCGVEFFPGRGTPVGWAAFPAGNGLTEQGLSGFKFCSNHLFFIHHILSIMRNILVQKSVHVTS